MIHIALCGAYGRMGKAITEAVTEDRTFGLSYLIDTKEDSLMAAIGKAVRLSDIIDAADLDVVVDFTPPESVLYNLKLAVANKRPFVTGSTGFTPEQFAEFKDIAKNGRVFYSPNFSLGIYVMQNLLKKAAELMPEGYDVEIVDFHHNKKVDAPSGTALRLAEILTDAYTDRELVFGRGRGIQPRKVSDITIHALRGGDVVGDHTVIFTGNGERIELAHKSISRKTLASGVLQAVKFLKSATENRLYGMDDLF